MMKQIVLNDITIGGESPFVLIAGPCVVEDEQTTRDIATFLKNMAQELTIPFIFKASYDKANRTSKDSFRGPGMKEGLRILKDIKEELSIPVLSDVHRSEEIEEASLVLDIIQIPAFLSRQTDFIMDVARSGKVINIKKGQFLAPWDIRHVLDKILVYNENVMITERGVSFGYNNLVVDMCSLPIMRKMGYPVIFDATHSVQLPGGSGNASSGEREMAIYLSRAAIAVGVDGLFLEVHPDPDCARCDGPNSLYLSSLFDLLKTLKELDTIVKTNETP
ncbi:MAG: 3-deoxy-8-phosphooctulonate synthase [Deltaproteobacteria bacterium]|nr:3-deoxy-8-phosphooctulonate synthase [Deltaproteobacteria bacterium]